MTIIIMTIERETYCSINYVIKQIKQYLELATDKCTICSIFWVLKIFFYFFITLKSKTMIQIANFSIFVNVI